MVGEKVICTEGQSATERRGVTQKKARTRLKNAESIPLSTLRGTMVKIDEEWFGNAAYYPGIPQPSENRHELKRKQ